MLNGEPGLEESGNKSRLGLGVWDRLGALGTRMNSVDYKVSGPL